MIADQKIKTVNLSWARPFQRCLSSDG